MKNKHIPRILIAGTNSGCGKTTITCGILQALVNRGLKTSSFKCGPDYIDPMFHGEIIGVKSSNLDAFFFEDNTIRFLIGKNASESDISVIEGVMGYYDGMNLNSEKASTYEIAKITSSPVILTINCKAMSNSALAVIKGFSEFRNNSNVRGVILNNISKTTYEAVKNSVEKEFEGKIKVLGYMPKLSDELIFCSRHLGLVIGEEKEDIKKKLNSLASVAEECIDIDAVIALASLAEPLEYIPVKHRTYEKRVKLAVSYDRASCFYYKDNLELLESMGAEIACFSLFKDDKLPENIDGLYIGGGYPELYLDELSANKDMLMSINKALKDKTPCMAECGGFMYLSKKIEGYSMVGFIDSEAENTGKLSRFGYIEITADKNNLLCKAGESIKAHEFHYYDSTDNGNAFTARKISGREWQCIHADDNLYAGYPHIHFYSNINLAENFYEKMIEFNKKSMQ